MKIKFVVIGKTDEKYLQAGIEKYIDRLKHYIPFEFKIIPDIKNNRKMNQEQQKQKEGELLLQQTEKSDFVVLLDENGKVYSSRGFSGFVEKQMIAGRKGVTFIVGGPYGFSQDVYDRADSKLSLSKMTFSHQMVRLVFTEQLYRAFTIIKGEPYHHD